jgi:hypothetical protein
MKCEEGYMIYNSEDKKFVSQDIFKKVVTANFYSQQYSSARVNKILKVRRTIEIIEGE